MAAQIRIGTASWTDPGFVADWYPPKLPAAQRLRWYAQHFNYVEVNSTFYAIPTARTTERWCTETPDDFVFDIKLPKVLSRHAMETRLLPPALRSRVPVERGRVVLTPQSEQLVAMALLRELKPLIEAKKLGTFLLQLSPSFSPGKHRLQELDSVRELLSNFPLAVELRNRDWMMGEQLNATLKYFRARRVCLVLVDAPQSDHFTVMPGMDCVTNPKLGYFRFHGRNAEGYVKGRSVAERFDYDYSDAEVKELASRIRKVMAEVEELRVVANNNRSNFAPKLARRLQELLGVQQSLQTELDRKQTHQPVLF